MPTALRIQGYRFYFYSHEANEPPHVHIDKDGASAKFWIEQIGLARNIGFSARELNGLHRLVRKHQAEFLEAWHDHFGSDS
ncbi:MAG: DUF4160 domain-containing protein [Rhodospirillaceae bacterium]|nr:MAG: DUF4160 domain-containing protein [Rhodospirillaceae bacterium]